MLNQKYKQLPLVSTGLLAILKRKSSTTFGLQHRKTLGVEFATKPKLAVHFLEPENIVLVILLNDKFQLPIVQRNFRIL
jgi:hypothetical protein